SPLIEVSRDGKHLITSGYYTSMRLWNLSDRVGVEEQQPISYDEISGSVCPNPANNIIFLNLQNFSGLPVNIRIVNMIGCEVYQSMFISAPESLKISIENLNEGFYYCIIRAANHSETRKFIILR
ncbi:MAG: C-terminal target protein, partial [Bacteroidota bacterium]|nr:C-terminal target protein [Bacteroidota bacterium]